MERPTIRQRSTPSASPIAQAIDDYLSACKARGLRQATVRDLLGYPLRQMFLPWCQEAGIGPEDLDQRTIERFAVHLREHGGKRGQLSESSIWSYMKAVNQLVAWMKEEGLAPGGKVKLRTPPARQVQVLDREEMRAIERAARSERDRVAVRVLADTGMRPGELLSITGRDLQRDSRRYFVMVRGKMATKTGDRPVPLRPEVWRRLQRLAPGPDDLAFTTLRRDRRTGEYERLSESGLRQMIQDAGLDAGLERKQPTPYLFRHSACHWMLVSGMSTVQVAAILGHGSERMIAAHYANLSKHDAYDSLMKLLRDED